MEVPSILQWSIPVASLPQSRFALYRAVFALFAALSSRSAVADLLGWGFVSPTEGDTLSRKEKLLTHLVLSSKPDPKPAMASRKQHQERTQPHFLPELRNAA